ncbi:putative disease resistance RPP13-like protein 3 [Vitis vinifera]|uniref:Putative disease resistance RPP13-like protein 3 n=1 Tax=Vitis vinifera TaxID=29760 RepID=A0A438I9M9_VITVI|nr:putative disease resistance RPP13-like protein 3 [Vitis vinifera]
MQLLSEAESWKLFCRTAIPNNVIDNCPPELKVFGEKMVKKCAGLPLAIVVLGGLLSSKKQLPTVWEQVLNKLQVPFSEGNGVDAILSLSFIDLPHNLKSCFLYLGLFPEDWVIPKRELLLLWITEGFIPQQDEQRMEDTAEDYLNELINRNLIQVVAGRIPQLPHARQFPPSLTQLTLEETELDYDPMAILEKLQKLLTLRLRKDSYLGEEMQVSAHGFPRLKVFESVLDINGLSKLLLLQKAVLCLIFISISARQEMVTVYGTYTADDCWGYKQQHKKTGFR